MLIGERVVLRAIEREDLERLIVFYNDLEVELAGSGDPPTPQSMARLQAEFEKEISKGGRDGMHFAIEADGKFIGRCDLRYTDPVAHVCELGIMIGDKNYWGKQYGREAILTLLDYAFRQRNLHKIYLGVNADNERAIRAYRACGFVEEGRLREHVWSNGRYLDFVYMGILRKHWEQEE